MKNQCGAIHSCSSGSTESIWRATITFGSFDYCKGWIVLGYLFGLTALGKDNSQN